MKIQEHLTNEYLAKKFTSQFELVNYAIGQATSMILQNRSPRISTDVQNRATQVLLEIAAGKDRIEDIYAKEAAASKTDAPIKEG